MFLSYKKIDSDNITYDDIFKSLNLNSSEKIDIYKYKNIVKYLSNSELKLIDDLFKSSSILESFEGMVDSKYNELKIIN